MNAPRRDPTGAEILQEQPDNNKKIPIFKINNDLQNPQTIPFARL
jgi:hypothetical protein